MERRGNEGIDDEFFEEIKSVREMIALLRNNNERIQLIKGKYAKAIKSQQEKDNSQEMQQILTKNTEYYHEIKSRLEDLDQQVKKG